MNTPEELGYDPSVKVQLAPSQTRWGRRIFFICAGLAVVGVVAYGAYLYTSTANAVIDLPDRTNFFGQVRRIVNKNVEPLRGEEEDRINILLLGRGGLDHPGGTLADTIMIVSIQPSTNQVALLSLPRDLVVPINPDAKKKKYIEYRKINYLPELGGIELTKERIGYITGVTIHYYVMADFSGFRDVIDTLGGLDIYADNTFTDYEYPDYNYGYQTVAFEQGWDHFDGERALQYARSRHGNNGEGSDFSRARRQQKILEALRDELLSASTFLNPAKISGLLDDLGDHVSTDMEVWEMSRFGDMARAVDRDRIINKVVDNGLNGLVVSEISDQTGAYVLVPRVGLGNYSEIKRLAKNIFDSAAVVNETSVVAVQNASGIAGLAGVTAEVLEGSGVSVTAVGNAAARGLRTSTIYDLSDGLKPLTRAILEEQLGVKAVAATRPTDPTNAVRLITDIDPAIVDVSVLPEGVEFIVVLGSDQVSLTSDGDDEEAPTPNNAGSGNTTAEDATDDDRMSDDTLTQTQ